MNRNALLGIAGLATLAVGVGVGVVARDALVAVAEAAAGDVTRTAPPTEPELRVDRVCIDRAPYVAVTYCDGRRCRDVVFRNGTSSGFSDDTGQPVNVSTPTGFTDALTALTITNAKRTALTALARTSGALVITGSNQ